MKRWLFLIYGIGGHLMFLIVFAYLCGFVGNLFVAKTIDRPVTGSAGMAAAVDLLLVALFALQHSLMARPAFKVIWTRVVPQPIERTTYVWIANAVTIFLMWQWRPIDLVVWDVRQPAVRGVVWVLFVAGWLAVPLVSMLIHHFDLFGTRQVWLHWQEKPYTPLSFRTPLAYARVRHPLYLGWALAFWAAPTMTAGHLLFAGSLTVYMMLAAVVEERDLVAHFGRVYREYQQSVPMFVPRLGRNVTTSERPAAAQTALAPARPRAQDVEPTAS